MKVSRRFGGIVVLGAVVAWGATAPAAPPVPSRNMASYVLLGIDTINMKEFAFTNLGNVGVNNTGGTMSWGTNSFFADGSEVVTDILMRAGKKSSMYGLFTKRVVSPLAQAGATVRHTGPVGWNPSPLITPLPPVPTCVAGSAPVTVLKGASLKLPPGAYGKVLVNNGATLELTL